MLQSLANKMKEEYNGKSLFDLPDGMIEQIMEFLSYEEVAKKRVVSTRFNIICKRVLNHGFFRMTKLHGDQLKSIKSKLPRRESERRSHPLSKFSDILTCIETRLSMLSMTFLKYIELDVCCFIPGRVIDEVLSVLRLVVENQKISGKPLRAHEVLQELRDISSMAIEHFDEKIASTIKKNLYANMTQTSAFTTSSISDSALELLGENISPSAMAVILQTTPSTSSIVSSLEASRHRSKYTRLIGANRSAMKNVAQVTKLYKTMRQRLKSQEASILKLQIQMKAMKRRLDESEIKNRELAAKFDVQRFPNSEAGTSGRNIRPRAGNINVLKRRIEKD